MNSNFVNSITVHSSWQNFFSDDIVRKIQFVEKSIGEDFNPLPHEVLRFATTDLNKLKVVVIGQDPYPQKGVPSGRSFEVRGLNSWGDKFRQSSLRNILRNLYKSYTGELQTLNFIRDEINADRFKVLPPNKIFDHWESEGVLMLNTSLTCKVGEPGSHSHLWIPITNKLIEYINAENEDLIWFLWGKDAQSFCKIINIKNSFKSNHPMLPGKGEPDDFINCNCFKDTHDIYGIDWLGLKVI